MIHSFDCLFVRKPKFLIKNSETGSFKLVHERLELWVSTRVDVIWAGFLRINPLLIGLSQSGCLNQIAFVQKYYN